MKLTTRLAARSGAAAPRFLDVLTAAIVLSVVLWAAWKQAPIYDHSVAPAAQGDSATPAASAPH